MQIAPNLTKMLGDIPPAHRISVMRALTRSPRIQHDWSTDDGDCFWAIATKRVTGMSRRHFLNNPIQNSARTFGISHNRVQEDFLEWDALSPEHLEQWIAGVKAEVEAAVNATHRESPSLVRRSVQVVRELVGV